MRLDRQRRYFEQKSHWEKDFNRVPAERERLLAIISLIPPDVESILDVGCGNGAFLQALSLDCKTIGTDLSWEALKKAKTITINAQSDISNLPFGDHSFDLVSCLEVLEHLPYSTFFDALAELSRIAKKYIMVSVPNEQDLDLLLVTCPKCRCRFNSTYHVRNFSLSSLEGLFDTLKPLHISDIGPIDTSSTYNRVVAEAYQVLTNESIPRRAICPQCGYQENCDDNQKGPNLDILQKKGRIMRLILWPFRMATRVIWPPIKRRRWLVALYGKLHFNTLINIEAGTEESL